MCCQHPGLCALSVSAFQFAHPYSCSSSCAEGGVCSGSVAQLPLTLQRLRKKPFLPLRDRQNPSRRVTDRHTSTSSVLGRTVVQEKRSNVTAEKQLDMGQAPPTGPDSLLVTGFIGPHCSDS